MTDKEFRRWMDRISYSIADAAEALELSARQVAYYRSGEQKIPKVVELACRWIDHIKKETGK